MQNKKDIACLFGWIILLLNLTTCIHYLRAEEKPISTNHDVIINTPTDDVDKEAIEYFFSDASEIFSFNDKNRETEGIAKKRFLNLFYDTAMIIFNDIGAYQSHLPSSGLEIGVTAYANSCLETYWPNGLECTMQVIDVISVYSASDHQPDFGYGERQHSIRPLPDDWLIYKVVVLKTNTFWSNPNQISSHPLLITLASKDQNMFVIVGYEPYSNTINTSQKEPEVTTRDKPVKEIVNLSPNQQKFGAILTPYYLSTSLPNESGFEFKGHRNGIKFALTHPLGPNIIMGFGTFLEQRNTTISSQTLCKAPFLFEDTMVGTTNVVYTKIVQGRDLVENLHEKGVGVFGMLNAHYQIEPMTRISCGIQYNLDLNFQWVSKMEGEIEYSGSMPQYNVVLKDIDELGFYKTNNLTINNLEVIPRNNIDIFLYYQQILSPKHKLWLSFGPCFGFGITSINNNNLYDSYVLSKNSGVVSSTLGAIKEKLYARYFGISVQLSFIQ